MQFPRNCKSLTPLSHSPYLFSPFPFWRNIMATEMVQFNVNILLLSFREMIMQVMHQQHICWWWWLMSTGEEKIVRHAFFFSTAYLASQGIIIRRDTQMRNTKVRSHIFFILMQQRKCNAQQTQRRKMQQRKVQWTKDATNKDAMLNIARIANAVPFTLYSRVTMNHEIFVFNCLKCNQCLTCHKSLG